MSPCACAILTKECSSKSDAAVSRSVPPIAIVRGRPLSRPGCVRLECAQQLEYRSIVALRMVCVVCVVCVRDIGDVSRHNSSAPPRRNDACSAVMSYACSTTRERVPMRCRQQLEQRRASERTTSRGQPRAGAASGGACGYLEQLHHHGDDDDEAVVRRPRLRVARHWESDAQRSHR